jgi:hypothetical protein
VGKIVALCPIGRVDSEAGGQCYDHDFRLFSPIFADFRRFSPILLTFGEKMALLLKSYVMLHIFAQTSGT